MLGFVIFISKRRFVSLQNQFSWKLYSSILFCNCQKCHLPFLSTDVSKNHHIRVKIFARCCKMCWRDKIPILFLVCLDTADQSSRVLEQFTNSSSLFCCWTLLFHFTCVCMWKFGGKKAALQHTGLCFEKQHLEECNTTVCWCHGFKAKQTPQAESADRQKIRRSLTRH